MSEGGDERTSLKSPGLWLMSTRRLRRLVGVQCLEMVGKGLAPLGRKELVVNERVKEPGKHNCYVKHKCQT